jgi:hypothetical protein
MTSDGIGCMEPHLPFLRIGTTEPEDEQEPSSRV